MPLTADTTLAKPDVYETQRIQLTSPILHIGSAVSRLNPFEYVQTDKFVYLPNSDAIARALKERGYLNAYIRRIENREEIVSLLEEAFGDNWQTAKDANGEAIFPRMLRSAKWTDQPITELRPIIRNGLGQRYIPGSSIKGAMRTAIAYHLLKHSDQYQVPQPQQISAIERQLRQSMGELKHRPKFADDARFMNQLFSEFDLFDQRPIPAKLGPNTDFMRAVHISDSEPLQEQKIENKKGQKSVLNMPVVAEVIVSSHFASGQAKYRASLYVEMARLAQTQFTIALDRQMLSWFRHKQGMQLPFDSIAKLLEICREFAQDQWQHEQAYWQRIQYNSSGKPLDFSDIRSFYDTETCPYSLRIGWASGLPGTTIHLLLAEDLRAEIRDTCGREAPGFAAPKSRRTVVAPSGAIRYVPGWVKFKEI